MIYIMKEFYQLSMMENTVFENSNWSPFYNEDDADFALINKLLSIPDIRQRYLAHFRTILLDCFDSDFY